ncbi:DUF3606 domain-containing protein [Roseateles sp. So40a]|uniref:DUF3606 domain-containing protein n=1 Tax=Roseateles sp. So40a TaxID=3400226 RepID=UPI003A8B34E4
MSEEARFAAPGGAYGGAPAASSIDVTNDAQVQSWAEKLAVSPKQIRDAVQQVGQFASDVEEHLKGSRSTTNAEETKKVL